MSGTVVRVRRTQEERSSETRGQILDATLECLIELGYAGTSTPEVCRRGALSRGALLHHFPTREELVINAVTHLAERRAREIRTHARKLVDVGPVEALDGVLALMWQAFTGPLFHAALELWVAARSDPSLHRALVPMERSMGKRMRALWRELLPLAAASSDAERQRSVEDLVTLTQHLLRGMALQRILKSEDDERTRLFELWKRMALRELGPARPKRRR
jgi:AcrR family transcriptional regulator